LPNFENFNVDGHGSARAGRAGDADTGEHAVCDDLLREFVLTGAAVVFSRKNFEMNSQRVTALLLALVLSARICRNLAFAARHRFAACFREPRAG